MNLGGSQTGTSSFSCRFNGAREHHVPVGDTADDRCSGHNQVLHPEEAQSGLCLLSGGHSSHFSKMDVYRAAGSRLWVLEVICDVYTHSAAVCTQSTLRVTVSQPAFGEECVE